LRARLSGERGYRMHILLNQWIDKALQVLTLDLTAKVPRGIARQFCLSVNTQLDALSGRLTNFAQYLVIQGRFAR
jgi:hypothetical protein